VHHHARHLAAAALAATALAAAAAPTVHADAPSKVSVLLELRHGGELHRFVRQVSDPASPRYRQYASVEALAKRFGASERVKRSTTRHLRAHGLNAEVGPTGTYMVATGAADDAAALFGRGAAARARGAQRALSGRAEVPAALTADVASAAYLTGDGLAQPRSSAAARQAPLPAESGSARTRTGTPAGCATGVNTGNGPGVLGFTPNQWLTAYGHSALHAKGLQGQGMRMALVEIDGYAPSDIKDFAECFGLAQPRIVPHTVGIKALLPPGPETTLDLSVLTAAAPKLERIDVYEGLATNAGLLQTTAAAVGTPKNRPDVISISVGGCEPDSFGQIASTRALNEVYALAAGAGISVLAAAGDQGSTDCGVGDAALNLASIDFPGSSPYVTSVGGTNIELDAGNRITDEFVWNDSPLAFGASGGGSSILHDRPWYQTRAGIQTGDVMRTVPDITALADSIPGYVIRCSATECAQDFATTEPGWIAVGGTSAAAPLTAGLTVLADQAAREAGQPNLGQLNPLIYAIGTGKRYGRVIRDVTTGSNDLGAMIPTEQFGTGPIGCCSASKGYDLASGWGSLRGVPFVDAALRAGRKAAR
jgi:kumamolisin